MGLNDVLDLMWGFPPGASGVGSVPALLQNLVAYWSLDEASDGSGAVPRLDSHGENHLSDSVTVPSVDGKISKAAKFTKTNSEYLSIADNEAVSMGAGQPFTLMAWYYASTITGKHGIIGKWETGKTEYALAAEEANVKFYVNNGTKTVSPALVNCLTQNAWHFIFAWWNPEDTGPYLSVNLVTTPTPAPLPNGAQDNTAALRIGALGIAGYNADTIVDEAAIWKRLLTPTEKLWLYNGGAGRSYADLATYPPTPTYRNANEPVLMLTFDDGDRSVHDLAYPLMAARNIPGTIYIIGSYLPSLYESTMTIQHVVALHAAGWSVCNHGLYHANLIGETLETCIAELQGGRDRLLSYGFTDASEHLAYSWGYPDTNMIAAAAAIGTKTARSYTSVGGDQFTYDEIHSDESLLFFPSRAVSGSTSLATVQGWIDDTITNNAGLCLVFHKFAETGDGNIWAIGDFEDLLDYIVASGIRCVTVPDFYAEYVSRFGA